ncbi:hypothetical protein Fot_28962 [Forsythia ovata]|uniref:Uncharacterized protein n=1 Tax=Forsythia ovata TaxID=205694 RepID=A0ABD1TQH8_9LAMI
MSAQGMQRMVQKQEMGINQQKKWTREAKKEKGRKSRSSRDEEELEVLEDESLIRRAKKPRTSSSKSLQNQPTGGALSLETHEVFEPQASERLNYDQSVHIKKVLEERPSDINFEVFDMIHPHLQWTITIVNSFWTDGWASYFAKSSAEAKLTAAKALDARSLGSD